MKKLLVVFFAVSSITLFSAVAAQACDWCPYTGVCQHRGWLCEPHPDPSRMPRTQTLYCKVHKCWPKEH
jgi:hypothetical protein